jgi:hypothetical protein
MLQFTQPLVESPAPSHVWLGGILKDVPVKQFDCRKDPVFHPIEANGANGPQIKTMQDMWGVLREDG